MLKCSILFFLKVEQLNIRSQVRQYALLKDISWYGFCPTVLLLQCSPALFWATLLLKIPKGGRT